MAGTNSNLIAFPPDLDALRRFYKERAASLGLTPDEYVEQMTREYRAEKRQRSA